jgi:hypothetical protein
MSSLRPRPLAPGEQPEPGDIFFQRGSQAIGVLIRLATGSDINHTGVITVNHGDGTYEVAEANAPGFELAPKDGFTGYVVRVSDDPQARRALEQNARKLVEAGLRYDFLAIARFGAIVLRRSRPRTLIGKLLLGVPAAFGRLIGQVLLWVLPHDSTNRVICSGAVRRLVRETFGEEEWASALPAHDDETSPADLLAALFGRRRW